ncbi:NADH dehydrogenase [ubiquinone] 1 beta subcomplex subunit 9-like isoform X2 [Puntigrus tetrazona]|uniref:NADH dehydrogenase [ubiquinone] 1 beta subcomplex subunit 9-like isoform X2 n=1 Tax=Puntigrus tetrazona TaxID=1606681 RepID=UPI001C895838|nr:NADH dehydrogenase [ubiquinone] 1 beta subcomplex subunit 9-like isoform X2 [Puntigrus tetrazona]
MAAAYLTHHQKVLRLYKKSLRHIESWCIFRDKYRFYACLLRARFDENKHEKDMMKATMMLKAGEEEFWDNQHPQPYVFPDSPGGTSYERYECYKIPEWCLDHWHPSEKAMYPDYFAKREQWKKLRVQSWEKEPEHTADYYHHGSSHHTTSPAAASRNPC